MTQPQPVTSWEPPASHPCAPRLAGQDGDWVGRATEMLRCALRTGCPYSEPCSGLVRQVIESRWRR